MACVLKMATAHSTVTLVEAGYSDRRIADVLSVDRGTVAKYRQQDQNPPGHRPQVGPPPGAGNAPPGAEGDSSGQVEQGEVRVEEAEVSSVSGPAPGPESECEVQRELILTKL